MINYLGGSGKKPQQRLHYSTGAEFLGNLLDLSLFGSSVAIRVAIDFIARLVTAESTDLEIVIDIIVGYWGGYLGRKTRPFWFELLIFARINFDSNWCAAEFTGSC